MADELPVLSPDLCWVTTSSPTQIQYPGIALTRPDSWIPATTARSSCSQPQKVGRPVSLQSSFWKAVPCRAAGRCVRVQTRLVVSAVSMQSCRPDHTEFGRGQATYRGLVALGPSDNRDLIGTGQATTGPDRTGARLSFGPRWPREFPLRSSSGLYGRIQLGERGCSPEQSSSEQHRSILRVRPQRWVRRCAGRGGRRPNHSAPPGSGHQMRRALGLHVGGA